MRTDDPAVLESAYQNYVKTIPRKPVFTTEGIQFILDMPAPQMPQAKTDKPEQFFDASLMNGLEKEEFFGEMAKRYTVKYKEIGSEDSVSLFRVFVRITNQVVHVASVTKL